MIYYRVRCPEHCDVRPMSEISSTGNGKVAGIADGLPAKVIVSQPSLSWVQMPRNSNVRPLLSLSVKEADMKKAKRGYDWLSR